MNIGNLLAGIPAALPEELVEILLRSKVFHLERIVSRGHQSPEDFWYDQDEHEWVLVLQGEAMLALENQAEPNLMSAGMYVNLPAHLKHRVAWTHPNLNTVWLAIFYTDE